MSRFPKLEAGLPLLLPKDKLKPSQIITTMVALRDAQLLRAQISRCGTGINCALQWRGRRSILFVVVAAMPGENGPSDSTSER